MNQLPLDEFIRAGLALKGVVSKTPLLYNELLSERYQCNVYLKREDLQKVRSFKIRGAYYLIQSIPPETLQKGVVCASAGNHAQGVAYSCHSLQIPGKIFVPTTTPKQKISQIARFGGEWVEIFLNGDTFDDSSAAAQAYCEEQGLTFVHPFDDPKIIAGQGTIGIEIINELGANPDFLFATVGGGGLVAGVGSYFKYVSPQTKIVAVEPAGAASLKSSLEANKIVALENIDKFVDGAAVKRIGDLNFSICQQVVDDIVLVPEGKVSTTILELYNENALVAEPAGALPVAALDFYREQIRGKDVVCIISGGNNDIERMQEIKERSLLYEGLKHYFIVNFPQRPGALKEFVAEVL
ncbi:MAG: threonine ammonia-lyase IlvA, partial [Peptococcia bacterium]